MKKFIMIFLSMSMFLLGIDIDVVTTKDGHTYIGKIVEQKPNKYLTILRNDGSKIKVIESNIGKIDTIKDEQAGDKKKGGIGKKVLGFCGITFVVYNILWITSVGGLSR